MVAHNWNLILTCISQILLHRCAEMTNLPIGCSMVKKAGECCPTIQCKGQTGTFQGSQLNPGTIGGYPVPTLSPTAGPTPGPGLTVAPGQIPGVIPQVGGKIGTNMKNILLLKTMHAGKCA